MIRTLLATTAFAALVASGAMAQTTAPSTTAPGTTAPATAPQPPMVKHAEGHLASDVIGKSVYSGTDDDAENIGKVSDLVLEKGQVKAIVVGVGGFLGVGQKDVALQYDLAKWSQKDGQEWLVVETTADALKAQPEFDANAYEPMPADADVTETKPATKEDLANAPKPEENAGQTGAMTDEGAAGADTGAATTDDTATGATTGDEPADSATGAETNEPAMDSQSGTDTGSGTMKKDGAAQ